jgi:hypothetical protein
MAAVFAAGGLMCGCALSQPPPVAPPEPIICMAGPDCDAKWSRAASWIAANSVLKVQIRTDSVIQTTPPVQFDATPAFTVTKVARGEGRYEITFNAACGIGARCVPPIAEARARFTQAVLGVGGSHLLSQQRPLRG